MESVLGNVIAALNNIPQVRYIQAPAAFKVNHLKKFLSSKYDLSNLKKSMNIDIIYEGDVLSDDFSLMDIAYTYRWQRVSADQTSKLLTIPLITSLFITPSRRLHLSCSTASTKAAASTVAAN
jgi:RAWUL domain RING finger- and  WD40-associated ubiquitin-like